VRAAAETMLAMLEQTAGTKAGLDAGKAPHMETLLLQYAYGKPKEVREQAGPIVIKWKDE
jgi:hypothetical protein